MYFGQNPNRMANMNERQWNGGGAAGPFFRQNNRLGRDVIQQNIRERQNNRQGARQNQQNAPRQQQQARQQPQAQTQRTQQWSQQAQAQQQPRQWNQQAQLPQQVQPPQPQQQAQQPYTDPSVMWEPITESTFAEMAKSRSTGIGAGTPAAQPAFRSASSDKLRAVLQNEKNAAAYYAKLVERHGSRPFTENLKGCCEKNIKKLQELHRMHGDGETQLIEIELDAPDSYIGALRIAVAEENKALAELSELCEGDFADNSRVTAILLRKLCLISSLMNEILGLTNNF